MPEPKRNRHAEYHGRWETPEFKLESERLNRAGRTPDRPQGPQLRPNIGPETPAGQFFTQHGFTTDDVLQLRNAPAQFGELVLDFFIWAQEKGQPETPAPSTLAETHLSPFLNDDLRDVIAAIEVGLAVGVEYGAGPAKHPYARDFYHGQRSQQAISASEGADAMSPFEVTQQGSPPDVTGRPRNEDLSTRFELYARDPETYMRDRQAQMESDIAAEARLDPNTDWRAQFKDMLDYEISMFRRYTDNEAGFQRFIRKLNELGRTLAPSMKLTGPQTGYGPDVPTDTTDWDYIFEAIRKRQRYQYARDLVALIGGTSV